MSADRQQSVATVFSAAAAADHDDDCYDDDK